MQLVAEQAQKIAAAEKHVQVECRDGTRINIRDVGGREPAAHLLRSMHESSKNFNDRDKQRLECAAAATAATVEVTPSALRIPTGEPLNMFGPVAWTASFVEFLYGDATPGLQRDREVLYEEWCQCLLSREELQHSMPDDEEQYVASSPSRFVRPEILACMHDGRRRLGMLTGARTYLSRKGFAQDLKLLGRATVDDIIAAQRSVGDASASEAMNRPDLRQSVRVSLKGLLFATANVPGTEGYRVRQRHLGNAMNVLFSPCVLFITLNFADKRSPIVLMLDEGPEDSSGRRSQRVIDLFSDQIDMPSL